MFCRWSHLNTSRLFSPNLKPFSITSPNILQFGFLFEPNYYTVTGSGISSLTNAYGSFGSFSLLQTDDLKRPTVTTIDNVPCATFNSTATTNLALTDSVTFGQASPSFWYVALHRPTTASGNRAIVEKMDVTNSSTIHSTLGVSGTANNLLYRIGNGTVLNIAAGTPINTWAISLMIKDANINKIPTIGTNNSLQYNTSNTVNYTINSNNSQRLIIGTTGFIGSGYTGNIAAVFGGTFDPTDDITGYVDALYHWLVYRYNLTHLLYSNRIWARYHPYMR